MNKWLNQVPLSYHILRPDKKRKPKVLQEKNTEIINNLKKKTNKEIVSLCRFYSIIPQKTTNLFTKSGQTKVNHYTKIPFNLLNSSFLIEFKFQLQIVLKFKLLKHLFSYQFYKKKNWN